MTIEKRKNISKIEITIHEGKNRQVRKMCQTVGYPVISLQRTKIGKLSLKDLKIGEWRYLNDKEIQEVRGGLEYHKNLRKKLV